jgi:hypothetical protein
MKRQKENVKRHNYGYVSAITGRRRVLSDDMMKAICREYENGTRVSKLADMYGVSTHTIYSVVYWTPRKAK